MLANDELSAIPSTTLELKDRLSRIDLLARTLSTLAFDVAGIGDPETAKSLIDIGWMLNVMREDLAADCSPGNTAIVDNAARLVHTLQRRCQEHLDAATIH